MGFMDKAKKMAEQAQSKLDEVQNQFNERQSGGAPPSQGPPVEYDEHGRPIRGEAPPAPEPAAPPAESRTPPHGDPLSREPAAEEDRNHPSYAPPKLTGGDPLS